MKMISSAATIINIQGRKNLFEDKLQFRHPDSRKFAIALKDSQASRFLSASIYSMKICINTIDNAPAAQVVQEIRQRKTGKVDVSLTAGS
jgi:hypothetical protein